MVLPTCCLLVCFFARGMGIDSACERRILYPQRVCQEVAPYNGTGFKNRVETMVQKTLSEDITNRLRRIEGQVRGIEKMLEEGRECEDMLTQAMAIRSAVDQVGARLMEYHVDRCLLDGFDCDEERMER